MTRVLTLQYEPSHAADASTEHIVLVHHVMAQQQVHEIWAKLYLNTTE